MKRLVNYAVMLFLAVSGAYLLACVSLNPRAVYAVRQPPMDPAVLDNMLYGWNINDKTPLLERYWTWLTNVFQGNWGFSPLGADVGEQIAIRAGVSLRLLIIGTVIGIAIGVGLGAWTATRQYKASDRIVTVFSLLAFCTPAFVMGYLLQIGATAVNTATGSQFFEFVGEYGQIGDYPGAWLVDRAQHLLLPTLVLVLVEFAALSRIQRNLMLDALGADYVRTARAKGLRKSKAVTKHALRTALIPTGTYVAFSIAGVFTGAVYTETVFSFPGIGSYSVEVISKSDINGMAAVTAFAGVCVVAGAILSDILVAILDPRVRLG